VALARSIRGPFLTTEAVVLELGDALARPRWRSTGITLIEQIRHDSNIEIVSIDRDLSGRAFDFYQARPDQSWGLTDCVSFVVMQDRGITDALSADQHFVQAGFRALLRDL
jgi:predicted nucleic acid-binding protein